MSAARPISESPADFLAVLHRMPPALRKHLTGWYEHTHDGGKSRTVSDLTSKMTHLADWYATNSAAICDDAAKHNGWHQTSFVNRTVTLSGHGHTITLRRDGTYCLSDTSGG